MLGMGPMEIAVIVVVALIIFGPGKLPEIGQTIGRAVRDFRAATQDITGDFKQTMDELQETADDFKNTALEFQQEAEDTIAEAQTGLHQAAKDFEHTTSEVNDSLSLDQVDSGATRPSSRAEAQIAKAREEYSKPATTAKKATAKGKSKASGSEKSEKATKSTKKTASAKTSASGKKKAAASEDRPAKAKKRRQREPAVVAASSAPSKDDPLADLMGVDDGPILSSRSRGNGRRKASA